MVENQEENQTFSFVPVPEIRIIPFAVLDSFLLTVLPSVSVALLYCHASLQPVNLKNKVRIYNYKKMIKSIKILEHDNISNMLCVTAIYGNIQCRTDAFLSLGVPGVRVRKLHIKTKPLTTRTCESTLICKLFCNSRFSFKCPKSPPKKKLNAFSTSPH